MITFQASTTTAAASVPFNGTSNAISAINEAVFKIRVKTLTTGAVANFKVQDSVNAHTNNVDRWVTEFIGPVPPEGVVRSFHSREVPGMRFGVVSAVARAVLAELTSGASCTWEAWLEEN